MNFDIIGAKQISPGLLNIVMTQAHNKKRLDNWWAKLKLLVMSIHCMWQIHESHSLPKCLMSMIPSKTQEVKYTLLRFKTYKQRFTHIANLFDKSPFCYRAYLDDNCICPATIGSCLFWPCVITGQHFLLSSAGTQSKITSDETHLFVPLLDQSKCKQARCTWLACVCYNTRGMLPIAVAIVARHDLCQAHFVRDL